ncbi:MAG: hypothetical protein JNJ77_04880 [Planctomycetia bacterium]|nr:hypothetical protein [Planctomycetia bacterium]
MKSTVCCTQCMKVLNVPDSVPVGVTVKCAYCKNRFVITRKEAPPDSLPRRFWENLKSTIIRRAVKDVEQKPQ